MFLFGHEIFTASHAILTSLVVHILAAFIWVGTVLYQAIVATLPAGLSPAQRARLIRRSALWAWPVLLVLIPTGIWNTIYNPVTVDFVTSLDQVKVLRSTPYGTALFFKHIFILSSAFVFAVIALVVVPRLGRDGGGASSDGSIAARLRQRIASPTRQLTAFASLNLLLNAALLSCVAYMIFTLH